jgi:hypothetical protein
VSQTSRSTFNLQPTRPFGSDPSSSSSFSTNFDLIWSDLLGFGLIYPDSVGFEVALGKTGLAGLGLFFLRNVMFTRTIWVRFVISLYEPRHQVGALAGW